MGTREEKNKQLKELKNQALMGGGEKRIQVQHQKGKLTARERIGYLLDHRSFHETGQLARLQFKTGFFPDRRSTPYLHVLFPESRPRGRFGIEPPHQVVNID